MTQGKYAAEVIYRGYIWTDLPYYTYILYTMVSAQQTNLLPKNTSQNDAIKLYKTSIDARLWRASLLWRVVDGVLAKVL